MEWNRSETLPLGREKCVYCHGAGMRATERGDVPCKCVFRSIFRICLRRFRECAAETSDSSRISLERAVVSERGGSWGRKEEEYTADFCNIARRHLSEADHQIFRFHFLLGADYRLCCRRLKMDRGTFFHAVYRIENTLGRAFHDTQPYPLYPLHDYFSGPRRQHSAIVVPMPQKAPVAAPLKRAA